jgi:eukaryotic-like serine/threonine-protein kinase
MLGPSEIVRAARLAVARYGAEAVRVQNVLQAVLLAQAQGEGADLLAALVDEKLLTARQANDLRSGLDQTQVDPDTDVKSKEKAARATQAPTAGPNGHAVPEALGQLPQVAGFKILRRLGEGGMGAVYLAFEAAAHRQVALKVLAPENAAVQGSLDRFRREAKSGRSLNHPNIVRNFGAGQDDASGLHYLVLEYVDGPSAHDLLERFGRLRVDDAVHIVLDVARALEHAHGSAIIHRDIKPANVLLTSAGLAKLSDLGLAKRTDEASHLTHARQGVGTPYYMPYEQALNAKLADARSDLFAVGATLYHLLTGEVPFPGHNPMDVMEQKDAGVYLPARALNPEVPETLERILARLLARKPEQRYPSASDLIVDLERSELAAAVPSFVDLDLALRDPLVRQRLSAAAQPTSVDVSAGPARDKVLEDAGFWYLRFKDRKGRLVKTKLTQAQVLQRLREGKLTARVEAARSPQGEFRTVRSFPEFRDVPEARRPSKPDSIAVQRKTTKAAWAQRLAGVPWFWVLAVLLGLGILALILLTALRP